jgi:aminopeptidase N
MELFRKRAGYVLGVLLLFSLSLPVVAAGEQEDTTGYDVQWYFLQLSVNDSNTWLSGSTEVMAQVTAGMLTTFVLDFTDSLQVDSVRSGGIACSWRHEKGYVSVDPPGSSWRKGERISLTVFYHGSAPTGGFFSAVTSKEDNTWHQRVTWTLSEPFAAREWFPCKQDLRDKADSSAVWITVDTGLVAGSNGILTGIDTLSGGTKVRYRWHHRHPIDYYLISFSVSDYRVVQQYVRNLRQEGDSMPVLNYIYRDPQFLEQNRENLERVPTLLELYSHLFIPYPFADEKYGHCLAPMGGGMEHQTMTTLASLGFLIVAHEMAHQWFGDYVTCATWQDIWINEGFASYVEYIALENLESLEKARAWMDNAHAKALKEPGGSVYVPFEDLDNVWRIFSGNLSYKKGASLLHMIRYELNNDTLFFHVLKSYLREYGDSTATGKDFEGVVEKVSGQDFSWFFDQWYYGEGYPELGFTWWERNDTLYISAEQSPSGATPFFRLHIDFRLHSGAGDTLVRLLMDKPSELFAIPIKHYVDRITPDPDGWLLYKLVNLTRVIDPQKEKELVIYPNPVSDMLNIYLPVSGGELHVEVMDPGGRKVLERALQVAPYRMDVSALPEGLWMFRFVSGQHVWVRKVVIRR